MAFFKFRKNREEQPAVAAKPESVEAMRRRAKHRLIGAAVLMLIGVLGLPVLFDKQPRPISVDTPIDIPDRNKIKPLTIPSPVPEEAPKREVAEAPPKEEVIVAAPVKAVEDAPKAVAKQEPKAADTPVEKKAVPVDESKKVQALLNGKELSKKKDVGGDRFVVQVGAFADAARAREVRLKVERAGLTTYTHVAQTSGGPRTRVRVGPFADRAEAEKAAAKIKKLDLPAAILTL
jgi:DedD protein